MKTWMKLLIALVIKTMLISLPFAVNAASNAEELDRVAVIVNNGVILESEIDHLMTSIKASAKRENQPLPDDKILRAQVTEQLVMTSIISQLAKNAGVQILDEQLDAEIHNVARKNGMSLEQLRDYIISTGGDYNAYRKQFRSDMMLSAIQNSEVQQRVSISPQEIDSVAKQIAKEQTNHREYNISHILIAVPEGSTMTRAQQKKELADEIIVELKAGENFAKMATEFSADNYALKGGAMGWNKEEELPPPFVEALKKSRKGTIIGPITSRAGYHIIKVNDIRAASSAKIMATEVHARHILIKPSPVVSDSDALEKAKRLFAKINDHSLRFESAAKTYSEDPGSSQQGGDLGWVNISNFDPAFSSALMQLQPGQLSAPVKSSYGWHLIELLATRQIDATKSTLKEQAHRILYNRKFSEESQLWLQEQRAMSFVKVIEQ